MMLATVARAETEYTVTGVHRAIASQSSWLNTSRPLKAEDLKGRIILLDFWTYCCINCIHVMPDLAYLEKTFGENLAVIGVHSAKFTNERDTTNIRNAVLRYEIEHPVVNDSDFSIWQNFAVRAWPTFILINPEGKVEETYSGEGNRDQVERDIKVLLRKYAGRGVINTLPLPINLEKNKELENVLNFPSKLTHIPDYKGKPALVISDSSHNRIVLTTMSGIVMETIGSSEQGKEDGDFATATFNRPQGVVYGDGKLYVADTENHLLREIDLATRQVTTIAGTGVQGYERHASRQKALSTSLASPWDLAFYPDNDTLTIAMAGTHQLWTYGIKNKVISVLAGNGQESIDDGSYPFNSLSQPSGMSVHDGKLYFVDSETSSLRVMQDTEIETLIGTGLFDFGYKDGKQGEALLQHSLGVFADETGVYIADSYNHAIRKYDPKTGYLSTLTGNGKNGEKDGALSLASFSEPNDIERVGDKYYVADTNNHRIRVIDPARQLVYELPITAFAPAPENPSLVSLLPNTQWLPQSVFKPGEKITFELGMKEGWKINAEAPSYLALFEMKKSGAELVQDFDTEALAAKKVVFGPLKARTSYRLQGSLYYCEEKDGAQCLIKSVDSPIVPAAVGKLSVKFPLN